ncbi:hypothetical protein RJT34_08020 [Clitoria ternatea]|uniref:Uncharacterized protein n=1 Tax=Clitoria ternatea TaxID=43366 RepID=A0AAN9K595_CLITE
MVGRRIPTAQDLCSRLIHESQPYCHQSAQRCNLPNRLHRRPAVAVLSSLIDTLLDIVEAIVLSATSHLPSSDHCFPCQIHLFARFHNFDVVAHTISQGNLHLITLSNPSFTLFDIVTVKETQKPKV